MLFSIFLVLSTIHCFGSLDKRGSVMSYARGVVKTRGGEFRFGPLSDLWQKKKIKARALLFQNSSDLATITVSSWCRNAASEVPLIALTEELHAGIENLKTIAANEVPVGPRVGYMTTVTGQVDNKNIWLKTVVLKMNSCIFDFLYVSTPDQITSVADFDQAVTSFGYVKGPDLL